MKRVWMALVLFAMLIFLIAINTRESSNILRNILEDINNCEQALMSDGSNDAQNYLLDANKKWEKNEIYFGILFNHSELCSISVAFNEALVSLSFRNIAEFLPNLSLIKTRINHLLDTEKLSIHNIF